MSLVKKNDPDYKKLYDREDALKKIIINHNIKLDEEKDKLNLLYVQYEYDKPGAKQAFVSYMEELEAKYKYITDYETTRRGGSRKTRRRRKRKNNYS